MLLSAILVALLATISQWWFFAPITRCLTYPLTTGLLVGIFMGNPMLGMLAGATIQLVYLGWINTGGVMPSNTMVAGIFGTALTILSGANPKLAVTFAVPFSLIGLLMVEIYQSINSFGVHRADAALAKGDVRAIRFWNYVPSLIVALVVYGIPAFCLVFFGRGWAQNMLQMIPKSLTTALEVVGAMMPALGIAMLLNYLGKKSLMPYFFIGFFLTAYLKLQIMAIAIFAGLIAYLIYINQKNKETTQATVKPKKKVRRFWNYVPSLIVALVVYGIPAFCLVFFGRGWAQNMLQMIPKSLTTALEVVGAMMPALGIAMLLNYLGKKSLMPYFFIGFFLTAYLKLQIMAIAIFAGLIAYLIYINQKNKETTQATVKPKKKVRRLTLENRTGKSESVVTSQANSVADAQEAKAISPLNYKVKLTHGDLVKTWLWEQSDESCYNYERLQALGLTNMMIYPIKKLYPKEKQADELKKYMVLRVVLVKSF